MGSNDLFVSVLCFIALLLLKYYTMSFPHVCVYVVFSVPCSSQSRFIEEVWLLQNHLVFLLLWRSSCCCHVFSRTRTLLSFGILSHNKHVSKSPLSSMVFGTNALFTKPAQSLAPMLVVTILNQFGYENLNNEVAQPDPSLFLGLHDAMFYLICLVPLCIAVVQILTWTRFSIQNSHLTAVR